MMVIVKVDDVSMMVDTQLVAGDSYDSCVNYHWLNHVGYNDRQRQSKMMIIVIRCLL